MKHIIKDLRELRAKSSNVEEWFAHPGGDCYGKEATVRGPFFRWFKCTEVEPQYAHNVAAAFDDVKYAAASMNTLPFLLDEIERLRDGLRFRCYCDWGKEHDEDCLQYSALKESLERTP